MKRHFVTTPEAGSTYYIAHPADRHHRRAGLVMVVGPSKVSSSPHVWNMLTVTDLIDWPRTGSSKIPYLWLKVRETFDLALPMLMEIVE